MTRNGKASEEIMRNYAHPGIFQVAKAEIVKWLSYILRMPERVERENKRKEEEGRKKKLVDNWLELARKASNKITEKIEASGLNGSFLC